MFQVHYLVRKIIFSIVARFLHSILFFFKMELVINKITLSCFLSYFLLFLLFIYSFYMQNKTRTQQRIMHFFLKFQLYFIYLPRKIHNLKILYFFKKNKNKQFYFLPDYKVSDFLPLFFVLVIFFLQTQKYVKFNSYIPLSVNINLSFLLY